MEVSSLSDGGLLKCSACARTSSDCMQMAISQPSPGSLCIVHVYCHRDKGNREDGLPREAQGVKYYCTSMEGMKRPPGMAMPADRVMKMR